MVKLHGGVIAPRGRWLVATRYARVRPDIPPGVRCLLTPGAKMPWFLHVASAPERVSAANWAVVPGRRCMRDNSRELVVLRIGAQVQCRDLRGRSALRLRTRSGALGRFDRAALKEGILVKRIHRTNVKAEIVREPGAYVLEGVMDLVLPGEGRRAARVRYRTGPKLSFSCCGALRTAVGAQHLPFR
jgi:hypothetical protein